MDTTTKTSEDCIQPPEGKVGLDNPPNCSRLTSTSLRTNIQFATLCWTAVLAGWNDASNGPLLPRMQQVYHVGYAVVSLIFVFSTLGFVAGSISNVLLTGRISFGKITAVGSMLQVIAYCVEASEAPFPAFIFAYTINGFGMAVQAAQNLSYVVRFKDNPNFRMGLLMAAYGVGALLSPLSATYFVQVVHWSYHYLTCLGIALLNNIFIVTVFRLKDQEACLAEIGITDTEKGTSKKNPFRQIMALKQVHILAAFTLCYVGAEVTLGGWIVTYAIRLRHGGASAGYISTGFWAGVTLGRVVLIRVTSMIGERRAIVIYALLAIALELIVWFVPSLIGDAMAVACIGVFLGPMYGAVMSHAGRVIPQWLLSGSMGWIGGAGQAGSALIPFVTGAIAEKAGIRVLSPVLVIMFAILASLWAIASRPEYAEQQP